MPKNKPDLTKAQLFIDDTWIEDSIFVQRVFHQPKKYPKPVLVADRAHEGEWKKEQLIDFAPRPVRFIELVGTFNSAMNGYFCVLEIEAYCSTSGE